MSAVELFTPEPVTLRDGTPATLRFLRPDDTERLKAFFYRLSPQSIFYRMLEYRTMLTDDEARYLCAVDGKVRVAIAATRMEEGQEQIIAVARYGLVDPGQPEVAEAAVVVEDDFQNRGLGSIMVRRLVQYARAHGVRRFVATIHFNNAQILRFIQNSGLRVERAMNGGVWDVTIHLNSPADAPGA